MVLLDDFALAGLWFLVWRKLLPPAKNPRLSRLGHNGQLILASLRTRSWGFFRFDFFDCASENDMYWRFTFTPGGLQ